MIKNIQENYKQAVLLAPEFKKQSLKETCQSIHSFLYWHFQYKQDEKPQMVRSLNCSWLERFTGIDCKSYSVNGGIILKQLGIKFYIRKIIQEVKKHDIGLGNYSHVYLIVPLNQTTGSLNQGYYTIDGTLPHTTEPFYIKEKSFFMDNNLPHYSLNGPSGLHGEEAEENTWLDNNWESIKSKLSCWGGSAYDLNRAKSDMEGILGILHTHLENINTSLASDNMQALATSVNRFIGIAAWNASLVGTKRSHSWPSDCTKNNLKITHEAYNFYRYEVTNALMIYLDTYFTGIQNGSVVYGRVSRSGEGVQEAYTGEWATWEDQDIVFDIPFVKYTPKPNINIPAFEITPYVGQTNTSNFDVGTFLQGLSNIIKTIGGSSGGGSTGSGTGTGSGFEYDNNNPDNPTYKPSTSKAVLGWSAALVLGGIAFTKMKDKPKVKPKTEK
ncbi:MULTISPECIES: hypothetical protein [Flavobacterium]|uniref:Uncharacterized protein n=1 Tax=Flavobacterium jumunjinense TaxID=998845 RepID=A0ABV5GUC9_9FLAO|nr:MULTISPECIES: hypothetical protein [Flavobacterium]